MKSVPKHTIELTDDEGAVLIAALQVWSAQVRLTASRPDAIGKEMKVYLKRTNKLLERIETALAGERK